MIGKEVSLETVSNIGEKVMEINPGNSVYTGTVRLNNAQAGRLVNRLDESNGRQSVILLAGQPEVAETLNSPRVLAAGLVAGAAFGLALAARNWLGQRHH